MNTNMTSNDTSNNPSAPEINGVASPAQPTQNNSQTQPAPATQGVSEDTKTIVTILLLIFVFPIGFIVMLFWPKWKWWVKLLVALPGILLAFILGTALIVAVNPSAQVRKAECMTKCEQTNDAQTCAQMCSATGPSSTLYTDTGTDSGTSENSVEQ